MSVEQCVIAAAIIAFSFAAIWVLVDAVDHAEYPCVWFALVLCFAPITLPVYMLMRAYTSRSANRRVREQRQKELDRVPIPRFGSDIERAHFIEAADSGQGGTMFQPLGLGGSSSGYAHFQDERAERLIAEARYDEAYKYLSDLYLVAKAEQDPRAADTYRHYLARLPEGLSRLKQSEREAVPPEMRPPSRTKRDLPF